MAMAPNKQKNTHATKPTKVKVATRRKRREKSSFNGWFFIPVILLIVALFYPKDSVILLIGLMPTFCAMTVTQGPDRNPRILTIALFNLSGVVPILAELNGPYYATAGVLGPITDVYAWFIMYGAAAVGGVANWVGPFAVSGVLSYLDRLDEHKLHVARKKIIEEWGEAVTKEEMPDTPQQSRR